MGYSQAQRLIFNPGIIHIICAKPDKLLARSIIICYTKSITELSFEWDEEKNKLNQKLHGISFEDAKFVFNDPFKVILPDLFHGGEEERWLAIGIVGRVLFVVFTERSENNIRIISARTGTKSEERLYNDNNNQT
jgi:uncharacterized DUF497 family protein